MAKILLGCIADDFTGATDLANNLVRSGLRTVQTVGVPKDPLTGALNGEVDAVVVALKSRTIAPSLAVDQSLQALEWLKSLGAQQIYFKYCSTFDSTKEGNIGPVTQALMKALATDFTVVTPAFPDNGRTIFKGHLFVGDVLLADSSMRTHPLTPMTDSNLVRLMQSQFEGEVALIDYKVVAQGDAAVKQAMALLRSQGVKAAVVDALSNEDLMVLGRAVKGMPLVSAGSGLAIGLAQNFALAPQSSPANLPKPRGFKAVLSGSCSEMTLKQVQHFKGLGLPSFQLDPIKLSRSPSYTQTVLEWAKEQFIQTAGPLLIYSSSPPDEVRSVQKTLSIHTAGEMIENAMADIAKGLLEIGVGQLLVAGGETSGKCVQALKISSLQIGPQIDPGVPWCYALGGASDVGGSQPSLNQAQSVDPTGIYKEIRTGIHPGIHMALKSGNFGREDFFSFAWTRLAD